MAEVLENFSSRVRTSEKKKSCFVAISSETYFHFIEGTFSLCSRDLSFAVLVLYVSPPCAGLSFKMPKPSWS